MTTMQIDRAVVEQALEALEYDNPAGRSATIRALRAALAQQAEAAQDQRCRAEPRSDGDFVCDCKIGECLERSAALARQAEPVARECSDPMCACRGGPCAECEEGEREKEIEDLRSSLYFYQRRCEALQSWQSKMRDPERTIVCDILANGKTLDPAVAGNRYTTPQQAEPEPVAWSFEARHIDTAWGLAVSLKHPGQEHKYLRNVKPLYTAPPQRKPLTEKEMYAVEEEARKNFRLSQKGPRGQQITYWDGLTPWLIRAVERAHGIKE